jgi:hypothetical protein
MPSHLVVLENEFVGGNSLGIIISYRENPLGAVR